MPMKPRQSAVFQGKKGEARLGPRMGSEMRLLEQRLGRCPHARLEVLRVTIRPLIDREAVMLTQFPRWARPPQLLIPFFSAHVFGDMTGLPPGENPPGIMPIRDGPDAMRGNSAIRSHTRTS